MGVGAGRCAGADFVEGAVGIDAVFVAVAVDIDAVFVDVAVVIDPVFVDLAVGIDAFDDTFVALVSFDFASPNFAVVVPVR